MNKDIFSFVCKCEGWKTAIKSLHWNARNMSQHQLCDDIADSISEFQDLVSEVEQSISGNLPFNKLKGTEYKIVSLKKFVEDVISDSKDFLKKLEGMGEDYIGMKSECETFISDMQRKLYLVNFTLKEEVKNNIREMVNERMYKNVPLEDEFDKMKGRKPKSIKTRIKHIYDIVKRYGIDSRRYHDDSWQAVRDYQKAIESLGCDFSYWCENGGYCDYDPNDNMPRSKEYKVEITYDDGMTIDGYMKMMACGTVEDPFSAYDTCIILWPKPTPKGNKQFESIKSSDIDRIINESINKVVFGE